ncbi:MFS transporter [Micromonospora sp. NPDC005324]|uniref:MFS transporter n=1 Tax=Micromonospora sp. NPDC005324 TaxID=3157033 RepID=UPI00339F92E2
MKTDIDSRPDGTAVAMLSAVAPVRTGRVRHGTAFWLLAYAFAITMAFSAAPAPLYVLYQQRDGFGSFTVSLVFASYAIGVVVSLFLAGHISDRVGRRRVLIPAVAINMVAAALFLLPGLSALLVARFVSGVSIGMLTATATAHLAELHLVARPGASRVRADIVATVANVGGIGLGPLIAGLLAEYAPSPLVVPYLAFEVLLLLGLLAVALVPETVATTSDSRPPYRPQMLSVPAGSRSRFFAACAAAFAAFAIFGLFTSLTPGFLSGVLQQRSHAVAGLVTFLVFAAGALGQIFVARLPLARQVALGLGALAIGLAVLTTGVWTATTILFLAGGLLTGAGAGVVFKGAVVTVFGLAAPQVRGGTLAGLFLTGYVGLAVPVLGLGLATQLLSTQVAVLGFAVALMLLIAVAFRPLVGRPRASRS